MHNYLSNDSIMAYSSLDRFIMDDNKENNTAKIILKSYPLHFRNQLMTYNLYSQDPVFGLTQSQIIKYPCIKQGCMTTCYFDAQKVQPNHLQAPCQKCLNPCHNSKVYLDVGFKGFLEKHYQYINQKKPLNVQINPLSQDFYFPNSNLTNDLISQLSDFVGHKLLKELRLDQTLVPNSKMLDFIQINRTFQSVANEITPKKQHLLYSFCKYHPQPDQNEYYLQLILFIHEKSQPIKVKLVTQQNSNICDLQTYLQYVKIALIGNLNTLFFAVPHKECTEYYVTSLDYNYAANQTLTLIHFPQWKEEGARCKGNLIVDHKHNIVFSFGGYDQQIGSSLDYMCYFIHCRWQTINNKHKFYALQKKSSSFLKINGSKNKKTFAFKNTALLMYSRDCEQQDVGNRQKDQIFHKEFISLGGTVLDPNPWRPFFSVKSGIRRIIYDYSQPQLNPVIDLNVSPSQYASLCANNFIVFQIPQIQKLQNKGQYRHNLLVLGGKKIENFKEKTQFNRIYYISWNHTGIKVETLNETFDYGHEISENIDSCVILLRERSGNKPQYYLRGTYPLAKPIKVKQKEEYFHYLTVQFGLSSKQIRISLGALDSVK